MKAPADQKDRIAKMLFNTVYPLYVAKVLKKNRTEEELQRVIQWLTGYSHAELNRCIHENTTFLDFFEQAKLNENAQLVKGSICGYKIEEIEDPLTKKVRILDKLVDELAKGKAIEKVIRT
jgi:hypothetical protein